MLLDGDSSEQDEALKDFLHVAEVSKVEAATGV